MTKHANQPSLRNPGSPDHGRGKPLRLLLIAAVPLTVAFYSIWYWSSSHRQLAAWYKKLHPYFYKAETWEASFFTETVKLQGNWWCAAALVAAVIWAWVLWKTPFPGKLGGNLKLPPKFGFVTLLSLALTGSMLALLAAQHVTYSTDEVFSALNFATLPAFQTLSHYPLPNNHLLFNVVNGSLFFWSDDLVGTGRLISGDCYAAVLCFSWHFLSKWVESSWLRGSILLVLAFQFPAWGFSGQARGYEMVLLFSCLSLGTFCSYFRTRAKYLLPLHTVFNVAGMLTLPTYLYWWAGLMLAFFWLQWTERRMDKAYLRSSLTGFAATFFLFLPLLSFSGIASLTENRYVQAGKTTAWHFLTHLNEAGYFGGLFSEWFCAGDYSLIMGSACLFLPALLFIYPRNNPHRRALGIIYYSILIAFLLLALIMLKLPFYRNLIAHGYLVLLVVLIAIAPIFQSKFKKIILGLMLIIGASYSAFINYHRMNNHLYYYDIGAYFNQVSEIKTEFKPYATVYLDTECFYWWHLLRSKYPDRKLVMEWNKPRFRRQDYCVMPLDSLPPADSEMYRLIERGSQQQVFEKME